MSTAVVAARSGWERFAAMAAEVLRRVRAAPNGAALRCIALSANAMPQDIERALAAGFADCWTKPIDFKRFLAGLDAAFAIAPQAG